MQFPVCILLGNFHHVITLKKVFINVNNMKHLNKWYSINLPCYPTVKNNIDITFTFYYIFEKQHKFQYNYT